MSVLVSDHDPALSPPCQSEERQKHAQEKRVYWIRTRLIVFMSLVVIVLVTIGTRAYRLQVPQGDRLRRMAKRQYTKSVAITPIRAAIYDRNRTPLALSIDVDSVYANPRLIGPRSTKDIAERLSRVLGIDQHLIAERIAKTRKYFVWIKRHIAPAEADALRKMDLEGVFLQRESRRFYPNRRLASAMLGFTGIDGHGLEGIERVYDRQLRGTPRTFSGLRDALGRSLVAEGVSRKAAPGEALTLTIDRVIQSEAEAALATIASKVDPQRGWASVVVIDPRSGELFAMATAPDFDPNVFAKSDAFARRNRAVVDVFEPGSTIKPFAIAGAIEAGLAVEDELIACERGRWRIGRRTIHDTKPYGALSVADILAKSSNIGVSKIAFRLGKKRLYRTFRRFGFGQRSGVGLPGERSGSLRDPKKQSDIGLANASFGQGMTATVIQLARAFSVFANGGRLVTPTVVLEEKSPRSGTRVISQALSHRMLKMLSAVTRDGGTGTAAALADYRVAGKTGTAQQVDPQKGGYAEGRWLSSFVGAVPATRPRLVIAVVVNEPLGDRYHGGDVAGPIFRQIASRSLRYLGVSPDIPTPALAAEVSRDRKAQRGFRREKSSGANLTAPYKSPHPFILPGGSSGGRISIVPDYTGMNMAEVLAASRRAGVEVEVRGSGYAVEQSPGPGPIPRRGVCRVGLRPAS